MLYRTTSVTVTDPMTVLDGGGDPQSTLNPRRTLNKGGGGVWCLS